jgi:hypothetical protein
MERLSALLVLIAGCGFSAHVPANPGGDDTPGSDAALPGDASALPGDVSVDGPPPCVPGFRDLCSQPEPSMPLDITNAQTIKTDTDPRCRTLPQAGGGDVCLIYATRVTISGSLTVTGPRPLAIASSTTITIDGTIDAGSRGPQRGPASDATGCNFASIPATDLGGGGGAAGGSFTLAGGNGGTGDGNNNGAPAGTAAPGTHGSTTTISVLRGGCPGQTGGDESATGGDGGIGGHSGGALYLFARQSLTIAGGVRATGEGGHGGEGMAGGGGGGTGGLVVIESPSITISGQVSANGGGGGQGGGINAIGRVSGRDGIDGSLGATAAAGGSGAQGGDPGFGPGGAGGAITAAVNGTIGAYGGGGGGGAAGAIKLLGTTQLSGSTFSPAPTP